MPLSSRLIAAAISVLLGFVFFPFFLLAAGLAFTAFVDFQEIGERRRLEAEEAARRSEPVGEDLMRERCDSPAESAFLDIMVAAFDLKEGPGGLKGDGLHLRSQVGMGPHKGRDAKRPYRYYADFLIDDRLVVEIDGAKYHSSPEAVERDAKRDRDMRSWGYVVLRIPAKVVFNDEAEVLRRIKSARRDISPVEVMPTSEAAREQKVAGARLDEAATTTTDNSDRGVLAAGAGDSLLVEAPQPMRGARVIDSVGRSKPSLFESIAEAQEREAAPEPRVTPAEPPAKKAEPAIFSRTPVRDIFRASRSALEVGATFLDDLATKTRELYDQQVLEKGLEALIGLFERVFQSACQEVAMTRTLRVHNGDEDLTPVERRIMLQEVAKRYLEFRISDADRETRQKDLDAIRTKRWAPEVQKRLPELVDARISRHLEVMEQSYSAAFGDDIASSPRQPGLQEALTSEVLAVLLEGADPQQFEHPYTPPGAIISRNWWRNNLCGSKARLLSDWAHR